MLALLLITSAVGMSAAQAAVESGTPTPTPADRFYTIAPGDDLNSIARLFNVSVRDLMEANGITDPNLIITGTRLRIPNPSPEVVVTFIPSATASATNATAVAPATRAPEAELTATLYIPPTFAPTATPSPTQPVPSIGFNLGGIVTSFDQTRLMSRASMTWVSISLLWNDGDSVSNARRAIQVAHERGYNVLLQISGNPEDMLPVPSEYYQRFAAYLGEVASYAPEGIEVWESMNSPDAWARGFIGGSAYRQMLSEAYQAIKRASPDTLVISGGLAETTDLGAQCANAGCNALTYLTDMASAGVGQYADCIGINYTQGAVDPTAMEGDPRGSDLFYYYPFITSTYAGLFPDKPLCFTRLGYFYTADTANPLPDGYAWAADTKIRDQAKWLAQAVQLAREAGRFRLVIIDNVDATSGIEANYAIVRDGKCPACRQLAQAVKGG